MDAIERLSNAVAMYGFFESNSLIPRRKHPPPRPAALQAIRPRGCFLCPASRLAAKLA
jgi:hypothetical protein